MNTVKDIQAAIMRLSPQDVRRIHDWLEEFDAGLWDDQIEQDARDGRLGAMADRALDDAREARRNPHRR